MASCYSTLLCFYKRVFSACNLNTFFLFYIVKSFFNTVEILSTNSYLSIICAPIIHFHPSCIYYRKLCRISCQTKTSHWRKQWHPTPVLLPGKSHGRRSLVGCSPWGRKESDTTKRLHFPFSLSCIGEGNGGPFQRSCLENPREGGAWWVAVYGIAQSQTRLTRLSSSSSRYIHVVTNEKT